MYYNTVQIRRVIGKCTGTKQMRGTQNILCTVRSFSTTRTVLGLRTKTKINVALVKKNIPVDRKQLEASALKKRKDFNNTPVKNASAQKLLTQLLGREFPENEPIGPDTPLTAKELITIFSQRNLRLTFKVLGTSGRQLQDSLVVDEDVQKLLAKNDLLRAKQLARMARFQGLFAYGTILQYLLERGQVNDAFEVFMDLKKRGYKTKGRFYNILISGYADSTSKFNGKADISQQKVEQLYRAFQKDHAENNPEISIIHVNSLLKVLRKAKRVDLALHLYDSLKSVRTGKLKLKPDVRTYTEMLRILSGANPEENGVDFTDIVNRAETIFYNAQNNLHIKIDSFLVRAYVSLYAYCDDLKLRGRAITILREWFRICSLEDIQKEVNIKNYSEKIWGQVLAKKGKKVLDANRSPRMLSSEDINSQKKKRFEPDEAVLRMNRELSELFNMPVTYKGNRVH